MDAREKEIEKLKDYKYGFSTDIENVRAPKGLNEEVIKFISNIKKEPKWMLDWRLKAFERLKQFNVKKSQKKAVIAKHQNVLLTIYGMNLKCTSTISLNKKI